MKYNSHKRNFEKPLIAFSDIAGAAPRVLPACSSPAGEISNCYLGKHLESSLGSAPLEGTATAILGSTLSAPFGGTRLHWNHRECSLGKHLESACSYPTGVNPYFIYRKRAWRCIAPHPHALRLVFKRPWSGTLRHAPANARAQHKSRQSPRD